MTNYYNFKKFIMIATKFWESHITKVSVCFRYIIIRLNQHLRHA